MNRWTNEAEELWKQFCGELRRQFEPDIDPNEVLEDMRRHIETEFDARQLSVVTADDLRKVLSNLEVPKFAAPQACAGNSSQGPAPQAAKGKPAYQSLLSAGAGFYIAIFGVLLPFGAMIFELLTRVCTAVFFDPLPSVWHVALFALIPLINMTCYCAVRFNKVSSIRWLGFFNAVSIGVAAFYTLWFMPILPFAGIAIIAVGIGFCGLAPLLSLIACLMVRRRLRLAAQEFGLPKTPYLWPGVAAGSGVLVLLIIPTLTAIIGLNMADSSNPDTELRGIRLMRMLGSERYLLDRCYSGRTVEPFGIDITGTNDISLEKVRGIYYRVTGKSFNTQRPKDTFFSRRDALWSDWDFEQGGDFVGGQLRDLSLVSSQIDANLQGDGAVGYCEWVMVFENDNKWTEREARCQIQLPPGGVVSRLTLWIDGQECEAAFGGRSQTKQAYKSVVARRRDPVLVTTKGPDQVLVQCFPVPANGGRMKIRLGISFPLDLLSREEALLQLPYMNERNFRIPDTTMHQLWVEADSELSAALNLTKEHLTEQQRFTLRGPLTNRQLEQQLAAVHVKRNPEVSRVWAKNDSSGVSVMQQLHNQKGKALVDKAIVVLDTSEAMKSAVQDVEMTIASLELDFPVQVIAADDTPQVFEPGHWPSNSLFKGGKDNMPALIRAWDLAAESGSAIIWIHAGQPHLFAGAEALIQRWSRRPDGPPVFHLQIAPGPNVVVEALDGISQSRSIARSASLKADLERLFGQLNGTLPTYHFVREVLTGAPDAAVREASSHIVRLWAREQVDALRARRGKENEAREMAIRHQLVTPISGAVVLENQQQYDQHGLEPADPETVPAIPEPATVMLMGLGALFLGRRRKAGRKSVVVNG